MADKLMYIFNDDTQNYPFCRFQIGGGNVTTLNLLNQPIKFYLKSPNLFSQRISEYQGSKGIRQWPIIDVHPK